MAWAGAERNIDPRLFQICAVGGYAILAPFVTSFERPHSYTILLLIFAVVADLLVGKFYYQNVRAPFSAVIIAFASSLIMDSPHFWIYLIAASFALASKSLFRLQGKHILNPANSGVVFALLVFPGLVAGVPRVFNFDTTIFTLLFGLGFFVAWYAKTLQMALLWIFWFSMFSLGRALVADSSVLFAFLPMFAPIFVLFSFHMITDPATSPRSFSGRCGFVFLVAALDAYLRLELVSFSNFYALFFVSLGWNILNWFTLGCISFTQTVRQPILYLLLILIIGNQRGTFLEVLHFAPSRNPSSVSDSEATSQGLFREVQDQLGLRFQAGDPKVDSKLDHQLRIQWVAPGVSVADFNNDGFMDIFLVNAAKGAEHSLFINQSGKGFKDQARKWGIADLPDDLIPQSSTPIDYNRDGLVDLILSGPGCLHLYENLGESFADRTKEAGLKHCGNSIVTLPLDYNGDGWMDLFVARFFSQDIDLKDIKDLSLFGPDNFSNATNGGFNAVYQNFEGKFSLDENIYQEREGSWTWDVGLADVRGDGSLVLVVGNDFGDDFYVQIEKGRWRDITDEITIRDARSSMNVSFGYWQDEYPQILLTNVYAKENAVRGNFLWQFEDEVGELKDFQEMRGASSCEWAWGAAFGDFDLDGDVDLYVANGLVTRFADQGGKDENYFKSTTIGAVPPEAWAGGSTSVFAFLDDQKNFAGNQADCLFRRQGESYQSVPVSASWDGRAVAMIDFDNNGTLELVVTTQGSPVRFLKTDIAEKTNWIGFSLEHEPHLTMGARVEVRQEGRSHYHWYQNGKTGFLSYSDPRVHFGLKSDSSPVDVELRLSNGKTHSYQGLLPGRYHKLQ
ncbi:MAG: VCBS repeat-containing protein [Bdellovibrionales bacterium]|nr:VCBS repeat-containing protein [Bdellovibrionales bacterium]